jgi:hypothetical protein
VVSEEDAKKGGQQLELLAEWTRRNCDVLPCSAILDINRTTKEKLDEVIGQSFYDTILLAKEDSRALYSDDLWLRTLAKNENAVEGVWTQAVLIHLLNAGAFDKPTYNGMTLKLATWHYYYTSIDSTVLMEAARQSNWLPGYPFSEVVAFLGGGKSDESAITVASNFIFELWQQPILPINRDYFVLALLDNLFSQRNRTDILRKLFTLVHARFRLWPTAERTIIMLIENWAKIRLL